MASVGLATGIVGLGFLIELLSEVVTGEGG